MRTTPTPGGAAPDTATRALPCIAIGAQCYRSYGQGVLDGVRAYVREHGPWAFRYERRGPVTRAELGRPGDVQGVITQRMDTAALRVVRRRRLPTVLIEADESPLPQVIPDDRAIGRLALEYFHDLGLRRFAFYTNAPAPFSRARYAGFAGAAAGAGCGCRANDLDRPDSTYDNAGRRAWLGELRPRTGLLVISSAVGSRVLIDLNDLGLAVPDDVAVLSTENDESAAGLSWPHLSGIDINTRQIGHLAAELLDGLMAGRPAPAEPIRVPPNEVVPRASSDTYAVADERLRAALLYIRDRACEGATVKDVLRRVPVCRRTLELAFQRELGRTVHQEIVRVRLRQARRLLAATDLAMPDIAVRCGYEHASNFSAVFARHEGTTPSAYRKQHRAR